MKNYDIEVKYVDSQLRVNSRQTQLEIGDSKIELANAAKEFLFKCLTTEDVNDAERVNVSIKLM